MDAIDAMDELRVIFLAFCEVNQNTLFEVVDYITTDIPRNRPTVA